MKKSTEILTVPQAAKLCAVDRATMWRWVKAGKMVSSVTPGGHNRIHKNDLEAFFRENKMNSIAEQKFPIPRILIVDDDPLVRKGLTKTFSKIGYKTETA